MERLREELRVDAVAKRWLEVVAPKAIEAFSRAGEAREHERDARAEVEAAAEAEMQAEAKAEVRAAR